MFNNSKNSDGKNIYMCVLKGVLWGLATAVVFTFLCAFAATVKDFSDSVCSVLSTLTLVISAFLSGYFSAKSYGKRGLLIGLMTGIVFYMILVVVSLIVFKSNVTFLFLTRLGLVAASSAIGGIVGINRGQKRKII